ncbi:MAG: hypothetical protein ACK6CT_14470 [Planctomycetia bacterium]
MLLSHRHRFAFVPVPKTGGSSMFAALAPYGDHSDGSWANRCLSMIGIRVNHSPPWGLERFRTHMPAESLRRTLSAGVFLATPATTTRPGWPRSSAITSPRTWSGSATSSPARLRCSRHGSTASPPCRCPPACPWRGPADRRKRFHF